MNDAKRDTSSPTVLVVEDEAVIALALEGVLQREGFRVVGVVSRGETALEIAERERPDVVLMDIRLAGAIDGVTAGEIIHGWGIPVVYLSAHSDAETLERIEGAGAASHLTKPCSPRVLARTLRSVLGARRARLGTDD